MQKQQALKSGKRPLPMYMVTPILLKSQVRGLAWELLIAENRVLNAQGAFQQTGDVLDLAIEGQGLFTLIDAEQPDNKLYTRDGSFTVNADGIIANTDGKQLMSALGAAITVPMTANIATSVDGTETFVETRLTGVAIRTDGQIEATYGNNATFFVGQVGLSMFVDPIDLHPLGRIILKRMPNQVLVF